ncbi:hypothetical protein OROHE_018379 [Orobanche hederae]
MVEAEGILTYRKKIPRNGSKRVARILVFKIRPSQEILKIRDVFKIRPSQEILKIRDGGGGRNFDIQKKKIPRNGSVWNFSNKLYVPSNVVQKKRVARILVFKIRPSQEILKIRDGTPLEAERILTYRKKLSKWIVARILVFKIRPSQEILKIRDVARILVFKIRPSQEILKIRDGTPLEAEGILTYRKKISRNGSVWNFSNKLDVPSNVVQKKRVARILVFKIRPSQEILKIRDVARILVFKIRPSQEILKIRDGTPLEAEGILTYRKKIPRNGSVWHFSNKLDVPSNVLQKKRVARILVFKIRPSQEILKIRDGTPLEKRVARILVFKIRPSQEILKIRDGTPLEAEGILTYRKKIPRNGSVWNFSNKLDVPSNVVQKKRVARILVFKIRPSQEILKIRDGTLLEAEGILTYRKTSLEMDRAEGILTYRKKIPRNGSKRVARILVFKIRPSQEILKIRDDFKIRPSQEILKIRDGTPLEAEGILTYRKKIPQNGSVWNFSNKLDVPSNVVQKKRVARILVFKIRPSQEILKIRDGTLLEKRVARILVFKIRPSQEILKIRDGTPLEAEGILTYRKKIPRNGSVWHFSNKLDVPSNVLQKKRVARILVFKIRPSQEILKIRDGGGGRNFDIQKKNPSKWIVARILVFKIRPSQEILKIRDGTPLEKKRVARILVFKIRPSQEILKIRDGTPLEAEGILTYRKQIPRNGSVWHFYNKLDILSNVVQKKRVARILVFKIRPSQEILKIRDDVPSNVLQKKRVARILVFKIRPSQEILKIRDGTPLEKRVARILDFKIRPSQEILKIRDGTPLEAEGILTYRKKIPQNGSVWNFSNKLDVPSNVVQKKRVARILVFKIRPSQEILKIRDVARILVFKIRPSQEILKIRDGTPLEAEGILTYRKQIPRNGSVWHFSNKLDVPSNVLQKKRVARILVFKIRPSQEILKIRDGGGGRNFDIQKKNPSKWIVARILVFKIRPSQEILKIRDGTPLEKKRVARILVFKIRPSQEILKIRDGTPLEAEGILTYRKQIPRNGSVWHFYNKLDILSNVVQKKRVARILVFKIRPSQEILKIRDDVPSNVLQKKRVARILVFKIRPSQEILKIRDVQKKRVARILVFKIRPSQEILKIRDGTPLEAEGILTYRKKIPRNGSVWNFSNKLDVPSNVVQKKSVARILVFKIRPSQEILKIRDGTSLEKILKIRDGTPLEAEGILTYRKKSLEMDRPSQEILKIRDGTPLEMALILVFKIRPSQEILKIRDGGGGRNFDIQIKIPRNGSVWNFSSKLDVPSNVVQKKRVARILVFKIRPSQEILKIRDGGGGRNFDIQKKIPRNGSVWNFSSKLDVPSNVVHKKRVARILVFKIRPSQEILKIRDGTPLEAERILTYRKKPSKWIVFKIRPSQEILKIRDGTPLEAEGILTYRKKIPRNGSVWNFSNKLDVPSNVVQKKRVARILVFKIRPSQEILKIRDERKEFWHTEKSPRNGSVWHFSSKLDVPSNVVQKKRVALILVFKIRPSQEILKIRDGTPLEAEGILTYRKKIPRNGSVWNFSNKLYVPSNVVQKKRVARILVFKIRPSQEILKIRDGTPLEAERILTYRKKLSKWIEPSQEILKIRDGTPLEKKRVARILVFKIRPSQEILKIRDVQKKRVARILVFKIRPSQEILKIRDGTPLEAEGILTYRKKIPRNGSVWNFSNKLDVPSNVVQKKSVARILVFKIRPSQEILKIRDGTSLEAEGILTYRKKPSKWIGLALF